MNPTEYVVVWCDSPLGLLSTRVNDRGEPVRFLESEIPPEIRILGTATQVFEVLRAKDGTKIAVPYESLPFFFGWEL
jgi:hypothetical protein